MALSYKIVPKTEPGVKGGGKTRYCAAPVYRGTLEFDQIASDISDESSLSLADSRAAITAISQYIIKQISNGFSLKLDDLGTFYVSFRSEMKDTPGAVTAKCVKEIRLNFRPEPKLKRKLQTKRIPKEYKRKKRAG